MSEQKIVGKKVMEAGVLVVDQQHSRRGGQNPVILNIRGWGGERAIEFFDVFLERKCRALRAEHERR